MFGVGDEQRGESGCMFGVGDHEQRGDRVGELFSALVHYGRWGRSVDISLRRHRFRNVGTPSPLVPVTSPHPRLLRRCFRNVHSGYYNHSRYVAIVSVTCILGITVVVVFSYPSLRVDRPVHYVVNLWEKWDEGWQDGVGGATTAGVDVVTRGRSDFDFSSSTAGDAAPRRRLIGAQTTATSSLQTTAPALEEPPLEQSSPITTLLSESLFNGTRTTKTTLKVYPNGSSTLVNQTAKVLRYRNAPNVLNVNTTVTEAPAGDNPHFDLERNPDLNQPFWRRFLGTFSITLFGYMCHMNAVPVGVRLNEPTTDRLVKVAFRSCLAEFFLYVLIGLFGYLTYKDTVQGRTRGCKMGCFFWYLTMTFNTR